MGLIDRLLGRPAAPPMEALYAAVVDRARAPHWYLSGGVPDTIDGRFDMIAVILSVVLLRLEDDPAAATPTAQLTERFITDMDAQLRELGIGDVGIGKNVGKMVSMLGGRLGAYRDGLANADLSDALARNLYRGATPDPAAIAYVEQQLRHFSSAIAARPTTQLIDGTLP